MKSINKNFIERSILGALTFFKDSLFAEESAGKDGFLQRRDPRARVLIVLFLLLSVLFSKSILYVAGVYGLCLFLAFISSVNIPFFLKRTWFFIPLFTFFIALPALFRIISPGEPFLTFYLFSKEIVITRTGLAGAGIFFLRVLTSVSLCVLLSLTTRHTVLLRVLRILRIPGVFVMTMGMCYRYIYLFIEIIQNTYLAIRSRSGSVSSSSGGRSVVAWNIASLWKRSYFTSGEVYQAMRSRGYAGEAVVMDEFRMKGADWVWVAACGVFCAVFIRML